MKHLGDITKINGATVPPVNVVIGGSPCQDLSVAGRREGLKGERSGLFMEQIRIIKGMRAKSEQNGTTDIKPRYMVWENVPGAFSSNKGHDFKAVLEETIGVVEKVKPDIPIPDGGWHYSGAIMGNGFSVAWRVFDAQFWGVPQRRRRIALIADFRGTTAPEILFERKGVFGDSPPGGTPWEAFASAVAERFGGADKERENETAAGFNGWKSVTGSIQYQEERAPTIERNMPPNVVYDARGNGDGETVPTITGDHQNRVTDYTGLVCGFPLGFRPENTKTYEETATTVCNGTRAGFCNGVICNAVRRLTPLECERLQGFPDGWTDIGTEYIGTDSKKRKVSDSARYKALGNSIALPPWAWLLERLSFYCGDDCTMASLFDGIGGFPLIWETLNGEGTCLWASEIEEFPIAVTKYHFNHH